LEKKKKGEDVSVVPSREFFLTTREGALDNFKGERGKKGPLSVLFSESQFPTPKRPPLL